MHRIGMEYTKKIKKFDSEFEYFLAKISICYQIIFSKKFNFEFHRKHNNASYSAITTGNPNSDEH